MTRATREAGTEFADLICDDPQWLRAEFDALISASFSEPPAQPPAAPPRLPPDRDSWRPARDAQAGHPAPPSSRPVAEPGHGRQRSPPA